jgi:hypothetical protein
MKMNFKKKEEKSLYLASTLEALVVTTLMVDW